jgi:hypothetical protein
MKLSTGAKLKLVKRFQKELLEPVKQTKDEPEIRRSSRTFLCLMGSLKAIS